MQNLTVLVTGYENSTVGDFDLEGTDKWIDIIENLLTKVINLLFLGGLSIDWLIKDIFHLTFIDLYKFDLATEEGYLFI